MIVSNVATVELITDKNIMIKDCLSESRIHLLRDREVDFIEDIEVQDYMTDKQKNYLNIIWNKATVAG